MDPSKNSEAMSRRDAECDEEPILALPLTVRFDKRALETIMATEMDLRSEAREILRTTRVVRRGAQSERISLFGAILLAQADRALQGNDRAAKVVLEVGLHCGMFDCSPTNPWYDLGKLEEDEIQAFERMLAKMYVGVPEQEGA